jgi:hypothetical protein
MGGNKQDAYFHQCQKMDITASAIPADGNKGRLTGLALGANHSPWDHLRGGLFAV